MVPGVSVLYMIFNPKFAAAANPSTLTAIVSRPGSQSRSGLMWPIPVPIKSNRASASRALARTARKAAVAFCQLKKKAIGTLSSVGSGRPLGRGGRGCARRIVAIAALSSTAEPEDREMDMDETRPCRSTENRT